MNNNNHNRIYVNFFSLTAKSSYFSATPAYQFDFNICESKNLHTWPVHNTYFKGGNIFLIQKIGVLIGKNQAPFLANLVLY